MLSCVVTEQTGGEADSVVESLTDTDSVRGLGETTDFLNMVTAPRVNPKHSCCDTCRFSSSLAVFFLPERRI